MTLDELLVRAEASVIGVQRDLRAAINETAWAVEDLRGFAKLPDLPPGRSLDSCYLELGARAVLPSKLPAIRDALAEALKVVDEIMAQVQPLPPTEKKS